MSPRSSSTPALDRNSSDPPDLLALWRYFGGSGAPPTACVGTANPPPATRLDIDNHPVLALRGLRRDIAVDDIANHIRFRACAWIAEPAAARQAQPQFVTWMQRMRLDRHSGAV